MRNQSFCGEETEAEEEAEEEALCRSEIDDFVQVIKTEPRRISACGFQHRVPYAELFPLKH